MDTYSYYKDLNSIVTLALSDIVRIPGHEIVIGNKFFHALCKINNKIIKHNFNKIIFIQIYKHHSTNHISSLIFLSLQII